jgi:hypothetical protein
LNQKGDTQEDANKAIQIRAPEKVVEDPPPEPAYPRYRVEPGKRASLGTIDPDETEHYRKKKDVAQRVREAAQTHTGSPGAPLRGERAGHADRAASHGYRR